MNLIRNIAVAAFVCVAAFSGEAQRFHCENDTTTAMAVIREFANPGGNPAKLCVPIAEKFIGVEYAPVSSQDSIGVTTLRLDAFDDFSFVNTVAALAKTATSPGQMRPKDLEMTQERLEFRRGKADGFPTRMLYGGDWIVDNRSRGNVKELTEDFSEHFKTKSLEWVSRNRNEFPALKDSATYERQKMVEMGYRTFKIPHLKREMADRKDVVEDMQDGDLVMILSNNPDMDVWEMGFVVKRADGFHFIHPSKRDGKVVEESEPLARYLRRHAKEVYGWRWLRIL